MKNFKNVLLKIRKSLLNVLSFFLPFTEHSAQNPCSFQRDFVMSFKSLQRQILFVFMFMLLTYSAFSNNISVTPGSVSLTGENTGSHFTLVQFDLTWENSWRTSSAPNNYDAAWVFVKYKVRGNYTSAAGATSSGTTITVTSTSGLRVGMPVSKSGGTGTFAAGTVVTAIINTTTFTVSATPTTPLSGAANVITGSAIWEHAKINTTGLSPISGRTITPATDGTGAFIYRDADGTGTNTFTNTQLRWEYGVNGVADGASLDIRVYAVEMVYVPQGNFYVGSGGTENFSFTAANSISGVTIPFQITSTAPTIQGNSSSSSASNLSARGSLDLTGTTTATLSAGFPTGYSAFYCMKYEISQQEYVDFLNSLTQTQATLRKFTSSGFRYGISGSAVGSYVTADSSVACNDISWSDMAAYFDWSGLRPMTELEFEKSCRGPVSAVANEYAWGTTGIAGSPYTLSNSGAFNEVIATNYLNSSNYISDAGATSTGGNIITVISTTGLGIGMPVSVTGIAGAETAAAFALGTVVTGITDATHFTVSVVPTHRLYSDQANVVNGIAICGNAAYVATIPSAGSINGPVRVGVFATGTSTRVTSGATYYGIMEMTGNLWDRSVTVGDVAGRSFTGLNGDGTLNKNGDANVNYWPGINGNGTTTTANTIYLGITGVTQAAGTGWRGGAWNQSNTTLLQVSDRTIAENADNSNSSNCGGRGVRLAP